MRSRPLPAEEVRRARLILLLAQGKSYLTIRQQLGCNPNYISRWKDASRLNGSPGCTRAIAGGRWRNAPGAGGEDSGVDRASSCAISVTTIALPSTSSGPTATPVIASVPIPLQLLQATSQARLSVMPSSCEGINPTDCRPVVLSEVEASRAARPFFGRRDLR